MNCCLPRLLITHVPSSTHKAAKQRTFFDRDQISTTHKTSTKTSSTTKFIQNEQHRKGSQVHAPKWHLVRTGHSCHHDQRHSVGSPSGRQEPRGGSQDPGVRGQNPRKGSRRDERASFIDTISEFKTPRQPARRKCSSKCAEALLESRTFKL